MRYLKISLITLFLFSQGQAWLCEVYDMNGKPIYINKNLKGKRSACEDAYTPSVKEKLCNTSNKGQKVYFKVRNFRDTSQPIRENYIYCETMSRRSPESPVKAQICQAFDDDKSVILDEKDWKGTWSECFNAIREAVQKKKCNASNRNFQVSYSFRNSRDLNSKLSSADLRCTYDGTVRDENAPKPVKSESEGSNLCQVADEDGTVVWEDRNFAGKADECVTAQKVAIMKKKCKPDMENSVIKYQTSTSFRKNKPATAMCKSAAEIAAYESRRKEERTTKNEIQAAEKAAEPPREPRKTPIGEWPKQATHFGKEPPNAKTCRVTETNGDLIWEDTWYIGGDHACNETLRKMVEMRKCDSKNLGKTFNVKNHLSKSKKIIDVAIKCPMISGGKDLPVCRVYNEDDTVLWEYTEQFLGPMGCFNAVDKILLQKKCGGSNAGKRLDYQVVTFEGQAPKTHGFTCPK